MFRILKISGLVIVLLVLSILADYFFFGFINPLGCDYKGIHMKESENGLSVTLHSSYSYDEFYKLIVKNPEYKVRVDGDAQFYVTRVVDSLEISMLVNKDLNEKIKYSLDLNGNPYNYNSDFHQGSECSQPKFVISNKVKTFIMDLHFPSDLESELLKSYTIMPVINI